MPGAYELAVERREGSDDPWTIVKNLGHFELQPGDPAYLGQIDVKPSAAVSEVSISGTAALGRELSVRTSGLAPADATLAYRWLRDGAPIPGAVGATYRPVLADAGRALAVEVTASHEHYYPMARTSPRVTVAQVKGTVELTRSASSQVFGTKSPAQVVAVVEVEHGTPAGRVVLRSGSKKLGTVPAKKGVAIFKLPRTLAVGSHRLTAVFEPSASAYARATSPAVSLKVTKAKPKVTAKLMKKTVTKKTRPKVKVKVSATGVANPPGALTSMRPAVLAPDDCRPLRHARPWRETPPIG